MKLLNNVLFFQLICDLNEAHILLLLTDVVVTMACLNLCTLASDVNLS